MMGIVLEDIRVTTPIEERCDICNREIAVFECDMQTSYVKTIISFSDGHAEMHDGPIYCNRKMCEKCAVEVNPGIHFCLRCVRERKSKLANIHL